MTQEGVYVGVRRTYDHGRTILPLGPATDKQARNRRLTQTRDSACAQPGTHAPNPQGVRHAPAGVTLPADDPRRNGDPRTDRYGLSPGPHNDPPRHGPAGAVEWQDGQPIDLSNTPSAGRDCQCAACRERRATSDEALEEGMTTSDSLASVNVRNRRKYGQPAIRR